MNDPCDIFEPNQTILYETPIKNEDIVLSDGKTPVKEKSFSLSAVLIVFLIAGLLFCGGLNAGQNTGTAMKRRIINPWTWQDRNGFFGFVHANEITNPRRLLFTAGQVSVDKDGNLLYPGNMGKQITQVLDNLETILDQADLHLKDVVRFTYYTTDIQAFMNPEARRVLSDRLQRANCKPATSLIGVKSLFHPDCVIEIEAVIAN